MTITYTQYLRESDALNDTGLVCPVDVDLLRNSHDFCYHRPHSLVQRWPVYVVII